MYLVNWISKNNYKREAEIKADSLYDAILITIERYNIDGEQITNVTKTK